MRAPTVVVVGGGVAGTAAALTAARLGGRVTMVDGGTGATTLATGALDVVHWQRDPAPPAQLADPAREVLSALGNYCHPDAGAHLATTSGIVRPVRGHDAALVDVGMAGTGLIGVAACRRSGWDARVLAAAWGEGFAPIDVVVMRHVDEPSAPDADLAARHDEEGRLGWLAERLREGLSRAGRAFKGVVLPPCLGVERPRAQELTRLVGLPCGEAIGAPGGPPGLRFERARDRALSAYGIEHLRARATGIHRGGAGWRVTMGDPAPAGLDALDADAVVLATGGLIGGGLEYAPSESILASALPHFARQAFQLTVSAPAQLGAHGRPLDLPGSLFGTAPESIAWPFAADALMDRVGVLAGRDGRVAPGLFAAGDVMADRPRAWLEALGAGAAAGAAALGCVGGAISAGVAP